MFHAKRTLTFMMGAVALCAGPAFAVGGTLTTVTVVVLIAEAPLLSVTRSATW